MKGDERTTNHSGRKRTGTDTGTDTGTSAKRSISSGVRGDERSAQANNADVESVDNRATNPSESTSGIPTGNNSATKQIDRDGITRGRSRRTRRGSNHSSTGTGIGTGTGTADTEKTTEPHTEIPLFIGQKRRGRKPKNAKGDTQKLIAISMLSIGTVAGFGIVAQFFGEHWKLRQDEAHLFATQLNDALSTLPDSQYEKLFKFVEQYIPWIALVITTGQIVIPRYKQTQRLAFESRNASNRDYNPFDRRSNVSNNGTVDDYTNDKTDVGSGVTEFSRKYK